MLSKNLPRKWLVLVNNFINYNLSLKSVKCYVTNSPKIKQNICYVENICLSICLYWVLSISENIICITLDRVQHTKPFLKPKL